MIILKNECGDEVDAIEYEDLDILIHFDDVGEWFSYNDWFVCVEGGYAFRIHPEAIVKIQPSIANWTDFQTFIDACIEDEWV